MIADEVFKPRNVKTGVLYKDDRPEYAQAYKQKIASRAKK
jgi:hypothetical protein